MKPAAILGLMLCLLMTGLWALANDQPQPLTDQPAPEVSAFLRKNYADYALEDYILILGTPKGDYGFALVAKGGSRRLLGFHGQGGQLTYWLRNDSAAPQGAGQVSFNRNSTGHYIREGQPYPNNWGFTIYRLEPGNVEYTMQMVSYHWENDGFKLLMYEDRDYYDVMRMHASAQGIRYEEHLDGYQKGFVPGTVQRDIRYVDFAALPKTIEALKKSLTEVPSIPAGELKAQKIKFTGGRKYAVYSAPSEQAVRGGKGKALVSTNDWIQVFGEENGFILIQYAIDSQHMRMGYMEAAALPKGASVGPLSLGAAPVVLANAAPLTDDPLYSRAALAQLAQGQQLTQLAGMGSWAYVETVVNGLTARGFVAKDSLQMLGGTPQPQTTPGIPAGNLFSATLPIGSYWTSVAVDLSEDAQAWEVAIHVALKASIQSVSRPEAPVGFHLMAGGKPVLPALRVADDKGQALYRLSVPIQPQQKELVIAPEYPAIGIDVEGVEVLTIR